MQSLTMLMLAGLTGSALGFALRRARMHSSAYSVERQPLSAHTTLLVLRNGEREIMLVESARSITRITHGSESSMHAGQRLALNQAARPAVAAETTG